MSEFIKKIHDTHAHKFNRVFEIFPGFMIWLILLSPFWLASSIPILLGNLIVVFAVYWLYRAIIFIIGLIIGYNQYSDEISVDWLGEIKNLDFENLPDQQTLPENTEFKDHRKFMPKQLVVVPVGGADYDVLKPTLDAVLAQNYPTELLYISLSFEERLIDKNPKYFKGIQKQIKKDFEVFGDRLMIFDHPKDIPGEAVGAAANRTWGNKKAIETLEKAGENIENFITTSPDEDLRFHPEYFGAMAYRYLISQKRKRKFYQTACYFFFNNYWKVPSGIRAWSMSLSLPVLSSSVTHLHDRETWSCYSVCLDVLQAVDYWDTSIGIDDTPFFWRPFDYFDGDFKCETFFVPLYADAVYHPSVFENHRAQYKQLVRWGWGVIAFPIAMKVLFSNPNIPIRKKLRKFYIMFEVIVLFKVAALLFTFAIPIMNYLNPEFTYSVSTITLPNTLSQIMTLLTILIIPSNFYKFLLSPPHPGGWSRARVLLSVIIEIPLQILILFTYAFIPFLEGPTKLMFGNKYKFVVTEKKS